MDEQYIIEENEVRDLIIEHENMNTKFNAIQKKYFYDCDRYLPLLEKISFKKEFLIFEKYLDIKYLQIYNLSSTTFSAKKEILSKIQKIKQRNNILIWRTSKRKSIGLGR